jgi:hypothetical protein
LSMGPHSQHNRGSVPVYQWPGTRFSTPLLLLTIPNISCHPGTLQHLWWWLSLLLLWRLSDKHDLPLLIQLMQRLCQHTLIPVVEHIPTQSERIRGTEHVRLEQPTCMSIGRPSMLPSPPRSNHHSSNRKCCSVSGWQLMLGIVRSNSSVERQVLRDWY